MQGNIPVLKVVARTLPAAWEEALIKTWEAGIPVPTEYDKEGEFRSRDCSMIIVIEEPFSEPRIHRALPGGLEELEIYKLEVLEGIHDAWIKPEEGKWSYTYHERLFNYPQGEVRINQIENIIRKLSEVPFSRRAQAITWEPKRDTVSVDPPCLQRIWFRLLQGANGKLFLNMNTHWRSRDAFKAAFMNIFALTELQKKVAEALAQKMSQEIKIGRYVDISDSFHIYGSYYGEFSDFLETLRRRKFEERTWSTDFAKPFFEEARKKVKKE
jgi:thymidylate synthase